MGILDIFRGRKAPQRQGTGLEVARWEGAPPRRGTYELLKGYKEIPFLRLCVETASDGVAGVCWTAYRRKAKGTGETVRDHGLKFADATSRRRRIKTLAASEEIEEVADHPVLKLLADPSDMLTGRAVTKLMQTYLDLPGEAFLAIERRGGVPVGLWPVPPHWVIQLPDNRMPAAQRIYRVSAGGVYRDIPAADMIHLRHLDPDDPMGRGIGSAFALGDELDSDEYAARFVKNSFFNNMTPGAIAAIEGGPADPNHPAFKAFRESLAREHQGPEKAGKMLITNGKVSFARLDTSFKDMDLVNYRKFIRDFIRTTYRIPPEILGDMTSSNKATAYASREIFAEQVIAPRLEFLRTEFQKRLVPLLGDDVVLDYESPVPEDREFQLRAMTALPMAYSFDEHRAVAGFKPDPERQGYPAPMPGQDTSQPRAPGDAQQGSAADTKDEVAENEAAAKAIGDPAWAGQPLP